MRSSLAVDRNVDTLFLQIAEYLFDPPSFCEEAYQTALSALLDAIGCGCLALSYPACAKLLGPTVEGTIVPKGARVFATPYELDPVTAAFNIGAMVRWLDFNDTWLAAEWGHPSDNFGALLALADFLTRGGQRISMRQFLTWAIQAYEIQGLLALENSFNRVGLDHVLLVKVASAALSALMLGGTREQVIDALSQAWVDLGPLRTYRHAPNTGSRKSWAAGDASARGLQLAMMTMRGEGGYPTALSAPRWGFCDVMMGGREIAVPRPFGSYVMENILFKVSYPAEFHAQTALEAAIALYPQIQSRWDEIEWIEIKTQEAAIRIIDKRGALRSPADRDHCLQYITAVGLLYGTLTADHYEDLAAQDPRIDKLREVMRVSEDAQYSRDYLDPEKRAIANSVALHMRGGRVIGPCEVLYPLGHKRRSREAEPYLLDKLRRNLLAAYDERRVQAIVEATGRMEPTLQGSFQEFYRLFL